MPLLSPVVHPERAALLAKMTAGCTVGFLIILEISVIALRKVVSNRGLRPTTATFFSSCVMSMVNALTTSIFAISAFYQLMVADETPTLTLAAPLSLIYSCAITIAYFIADCYLMVRYREDCKQEMGSVGLSIMWVHHSISLVLWPYCLLTHKSVLFVSYFLFTEVTNVGQNIYHWYNKTGASAKVICIVGGMWLLSFFVVRIVPLPWMLYQYGRLHLEGGVGQSSLETGVSLLTVPLPFMLNTYWFILIVRKGIRMLSGSSKASKESKAQ